MGLEKMNQNREDQRERGKTEKTSQGFNHPDNVDLKANILTWISFQK